MKKDKFFQRLALAVAVFSYITIIYLSIGQFYNKNFLTGKSIMLFILLALNTICLLAYTCSRYYISQLCSVEYTPNGAIVKAYCTCHGRKLKYIKRSYQSVDESFALRDVTCSLAQTKFRKILDENHDEGDKIYKTTLIYIAFSFFLVSIIGFIASLTRFFNIYNDIFYYYRTVAAAKKLLPVFATTIAILMSFFTFYLYRALLTFKKDEKLWINTTDRLPITSESSQPLLPSPIQSELDPLLVSIDDIIPKPFTASRLSPLPSSSGVFTSSSLPPSPILRPRPMLKSLTSSSGVFTSLSLPSSPVSTPPELNLFFASADDAIQKSPSTSRVWTPLSSFSTSSSPTLTPRSVSPVCSSDEDYHENILLSVLPVCSSDEDVSLSTLRSSSSLSLGSCMHSPTKY